MADQAHAGNQQHAMGRIGQQIMLVAGDVFHADALDIVDCSAQAHRIGDIAGAVGLGAAIDYIERIGMENIAR